MTPIYSSIYGNSLYGAFNKATFSDFPEQFEELFLECFYLRYGARHIACELPQRFAQWVNGRMLERSAYYRDLIKSATFVKNPLINKLVQESEQTNSAMRYRNLGTSSGQALGRTENNSADFAMSNSASDSETMGNHATSSETVTKDKGLQRHTNDQKTTENQEDRFSDTPQQPLGQAADDPSKVWNSDYLTTASTETKVSKVGATQYGADSRTGENSNRGTASDATAATSLTAQNSQNVTNANGHTHHQNKANTLTDGARVTEGNEGRTIQGLDGVLVSEAVLSWRKQMFPVISVILDDFSDCFLTVY